MRKTIAFTLVGLALVGCAQFSKDAQKSIYITSQLADGTMQTYAYWWKDHTNHAGVSVANSIVQRDQVIVEAKKVGAALALAQNSLDTYDGKVGTNTSTQAIVNALVQTAVQEAANLPGLISTITGDTSWQNFGKSTN